MQSKHFFIEIKNRQNGFSIQTGSLESVNQFYYKKKYFKENEGNFTSFYAEFQKTYSDCVAENKADILVYIHGLWSDRHSYFSKNLYQSEMHYIQNPESPIALTLTIIWHTPHLSYLYCRKKCATIAQYFAPYFWESVLQIKDSINKTPFNGKLHLLCHSMGNHFFETLLSATPSVNEPIFQELVMAAADVDADFFDTHYETITDLSQRILVLNNEKDRLLSFSKWLNRVKRLGNTPPQYLNEKYATVFATETSSVRDVRSLISFLNQHAHYQASASVMQYLNAVYKGKPFISHITKY